jgi:hypothetical protein
VRAGCDPTIQTVMNDCDEFTFLHRSNRLRDRYRHGHSVDVTEMHVASLSICNAILSFLHRTMIVRSAGVHRC